MHTYDLYMTPMTFIELTHCQIFDSAVLLMSGGTTLIFDTQAKTQTLIA